MNRTLPSKGFSLIEIAVVLVIITILVTIIAIPLATQLEQQRRNDTGRQLETIKEALIGYAQANGRLPCPATDGANYGATNTYGSENPPGGGACASPVGYLPAATLGAFPVDSTGFALDAWGTPKNRILYAIADINITTGTNCPMAQNHPLTTQGGIKTISMDCLASGGKTLLSVCSSTPIGAPGAATACAAGTKLTDSAPFVLISLGKNAPTGAVSGSDEAHNVDLDNFFVSKSITVGTAPGGEFDDIVTWPSLNVLFARMIQAGKLP